LIVTIPKSDRKHEEVEIIRKPIREKENEERRNLK